MKVRPSWGLCDAGVTGGDQERRDLGSEWPSGSVMEVGIIPGGGGGSGTGVTGFKLVSDLIWFVS